MNKLDEAKINLKTVLNRLEKLVESKLQQADQVHVDQEIISKIAQSEQKISELNNLLNEKDDEINYLREQNHQ